MNLHLDQMAVGYRPMRYLRVRNIAAGTKKNGVEFALAESITMDDVRNMDSPNGLVRFKIAAFLQQLLQETSHCP